MIYWDDKSVAQFYKQLKQYNQEAQPTRTNTEKIFRSLLEMLNAPLPNSSVRKYFYDPRVNLELSVIVHNTFPVHRDKLDLDSAARRSRSNHFYRVHSLLDTGTYPDDDYSRRSNKYALYKGVPFLITKNSRTAEKNAGNYYTEVNNITRREILVSCALLCAAEEEGGGTLCFYFGNDVRDVDASLVERVPHELQTQFLVEYADLFRRVASEKPLYKKTSPVYDITSFEYHTGAMDKIAVNQFVDRASIDDFLLLRTTTFLVKAKMLWREDAFREDAIANIFFALEGCMLLLQRKHGLRHDKVDRKHLPALFDSLFRQGSELFDFIDEAIGWGGSRANIVHAQTDTSDSWIPPLMADDFYEYDELVRVILNYVVRDWLHPAFAKEE